MALANRKKSFATHTMALLAAILVVSMAGKGPIVFAYADTAQSSELLSNQPPTVDAGLDQTITLADEVFLEGAVTDDGLPNPPGAVTANWSQVSGPSPVTFGNTSETLTTATFAATGTYVLRLTVSDSELGSSDDVTITVNATPPNTIRVPQDYPTIQAAIDAAQAGDLVLVSPGTYVENLSVSKTIVLASTFYTIGDESLIDQTVISSPDPNVETIAVSSDAGPATRIVGFTIRDGKDGISARAVLQILNNYFTANGDALDYEGGGGICRNNIFENNLDDGIDLDQAAAAIIEDNIIRNNQDDGIEIRLHAYSGPILEIIIRNNTISGNLEDGIQLIGYPDLSDRAFSIEHNLIQNNALVGLGLMDNGVSSEDFRAASLLERIHLFNNTFVGNQYGVTGGDNLVAINNIFVDHTNIAVKQIDGASIASYNLFWNNGTDNLGSNLDLGTTLFIEPLLGPEYRLQPDSPAIDAGTALFTLPSGETVLDLAPSAYFGSAPDLGAFESNFTSGNERPTVDAGPDQTVTLPDSATLDGTVTDDGLPSPPAITTTWSKVFGPGTVTFGDANALQTTANFSEAGSYVIRLTASDGELSNSDEVVITVEPVGGAPITVEVRPAVSSDDAEESASGSVSVTSSDLELVLETSLQTVGIRFSGVAIPQGATITKAYVRFKADETNSEVTALTIRGQADDNALIFVDIDGNISVRAKTTAAVSWEPVPWTTKGEAGPDQQTPDIASVIQEIVNRPGWSSGNALVLIITGTGKRVAESYDGDQAGAPLLHVEYSGAPSNQPPTAIDDSYSATEDTSLNVLVPGVLDNDSDWEGDTLTAALVSGPSNGTLFLNADGSFTYTPNVNFNGSDSFTYHANDGLADSNVATVNIAVNPVNDPPQAGADAYSTAEDTVLNVAAPGVLGNDSDADGDTLAAVLDSGPSNGALSLNADGSFTYTPNADFNGSDSFTYVANDGTADSSVATVTITVDPVNDPPLVTGDSATTPEDTAVTIDVTANDTDVDGNIDASSVSIVTGPANGSVSVDPVTGATTYTPAANFGGADGFEYQVCDDGTPLPPRCDIGLVSVTVDAVNDPPVAADDTDSTPENTPVTIDVVANDTDVDGNIDAGSVTIVTGPANGSVSVDAVTGSTTYTPIASFGGADSFVYQICDTDLACDTALVSIAVGEANDPPLAVDDAYSTAEDTTLNVAAPGVLGNDSDADGDTLAAVLDSGPSNGALSLNADGSFTYTPNVNFNGSDSFTYVANDGTADSSVATVTITVNAVNDPPVATFAYNCIGLSCDFDASASYDPDGSIVSYDWDFGDGSPHGSGVTASHTFAVGSTYSVVLTVTDDGGATDTDSQDVTVSELLTVHIGDLDGSSAPAPRGRWDAAVTITVHDSDEGAVTGALVEGAWSGGATGGTSCTTDASGQCSVTKGNLKSNVPSVTWSVSNVTSGVGDYVAGDNHDPDSDSGGTTIVVSQPVENTPPVATFTYSCTNLTCDFDGSGSYDPDGSIVSYDWDFGDGNTGGGATASHTYAADGSYTVVLTVTDDGGATDTDTQNVPVGNIPTMHVGDLDGIGAPVRSKWEARVTITVHDQNHAPLANATVAGTWSAGATGGAECITDGNGQCSVVKGNLKHDVTSVTFTVDSVVLAGNSYAPTANHDDDDPPDSDGTSITVSAP